MKCLKAQLDAVVKLNHPRIVKVYGISSTANRTPNSLFVLHVLGYLLGLTPCIRSIVFEYCPNGDVSQYLDDDKRKSSITDLLKLVRRYQINYLFRS